MTRAARTVAAAVLIGVLAVADHLLTELVGRNTSWPDTVPDAWTRHE